MATRDKRLSSPGVENDDIDEGDFVQGATVEDISAVVNDAEEQLNHIFSESAGGQHTIEFKVKVYRVIPNKAESEWLFDCLPSDFPIDETLRDEYNGGSFDLRIFKSVGGSAKKLYKRINLRIAAPSTFKRNVQQSNPQTDQLAQVVALLQQSQQQMMGFMREMNKPAPVVPQPSLVEMMTGMATMLSTLNGVIPKPSSADPEKMFDIFARGIEVGKEAAGNGDEPSMMGVLSEMVKSIGTAARNPQLPAPQVQHNQQMQRLQSPAPVQIPTPESDPAMMEKMILKANLANMCKKAGQGSDPGLYADFVIDNVDEDKLRQWAFNPNIMSEFIVLVPEVAQHPVWFGEVLQCIKDYLTNLPPSDDNGSHVDELHTDNAGHDDT